MPATADRTDYQYLPPTAKYVAAYAVNAVLLLVAGFVFISTHQALGLTLASVFGAHPDRNNGDAFVASLAFYLGDVLAGALLVGLNAFAWVHVHKGVEQRRLARHVIQMAAVFGTIFLACLVSQLAAAPR